MKDPLETLRDAGLPVDAMPKEQQEVLAVLTTSEVDTLVGIKQQLDSAGPDVQGHSGEVIGGVFF